MGIASSGLRLVIGLVGVGSISTVMNTVPDATQSDHSFLSSIAPFIFAASPYLLAVGALSAFFYVYFFRDKESQNVLIGWGILMIFHLVATRFFAWL